MSMPLMRFTRLPEHKQAALLDAAEMRLAQAGHAPVSWNELLEAMQLPRASAYTYFDGREDLVDTVIRRVAERVGTLLGQWKTVETGDELWAQWECSVRRVLGFLSEHPSAGSILRTYLIPSRIPIVRGWIVAAFDNARAVGIVTDDLPRDLVADSTLALLGVLDAWVIEQIGSQSEYPDFSTVHTLMSRLWGVQ